MLFNTFVNFFLNKYIWESFQTRHNLGVLADFIYRIITIKKILKNLVGR